MHTKRNAIVKLFPGFEEKIHFLFERCENFRDLCSDYLLCNAMILQRKNNIDQNREEVAEFEELQTDMKKEILVEISKV